MYLDTSEKLTAFIERAEQSTIWAIDTEFIREQRYYPQLCLIQIGTEDECVIIDPLAINDLSPLIHPFQNPAIIKVFHAGDQDLAIMHKALGIIPTPLFDTQAAASLLGLTQKIGLANLVRRHCNVILDKSNSFTNWLQRPLSERQIEYALDDVRYLPKIYQILLDELKERGRLSWYEEEFAYMSDESTYMIEEEQLWLKVKHAHKLLPRQLVLLKALSIWREERAQQKNCPRLRILADELLVEIVKREPQSVNELFEIRGMREKLGKRFAQSLITVLKNARKIPEDQWPRRERAVLPSQEQAASLDLLEALVRLRAYENSISSALLAPRNDLVSLAHGMRADVRVLSGWRQEIIGCDLIDLLEGRLALHLDKGTLVVTALSDS